MNWLNKIDLKEASVLVLFFIGMTTLLITRKVFRQKNDQYFKLIPLYIFLIVLQIGFSSYFVFIQEDRVGGKKSPINFYS